ARWFAAEASRIYGMLRDTAEEHQARQLVDWIASREGRVSVRQLQNANSRRWPSSDRAEAALQQLVDGGLGRWEEEPSPRVGGHRLRWFVLLTPTSDTSDTRPDDGPPSGECPSDTRSDTCPDGPEQRNGHCDAKPWKVKAYSTGSQPTAERVSEVSDV